MDPHPSQAIPGNALGLKWDQITGPYLKAAMYKRGVFIQVKQKNIKNKTFLAICLVNTNIFRLQTQ